ncbi:MAG: glycosyl hydrolase family 65 protein [Dehalococcoidia bacterium]
MPEATDGWTWTYEGFDPDEEMLREALCTVGNGYFATRGAAPGSRADDVHYPGTYAAGCYNRLSSTVAGQVVENESLVNLPNWLALTFAIEDGDWFDPADVELSAYRQQLDLQRGVLTRQLRFRDAGGRTTHVTERRFAHMESRHLACIELTLRIEDWSGRLRVRSGLDGDVENSGVARYRALPGRHLRMVERGAPDEETLLLVVETSQSRIRIAEAARTRLFRGGERFAAPRRLIEEGASIAQEHDLTVVAGDEITIEKVVALTTSRDPASSEPSLNACRWLRWAGSFDALLERHALTWDHLWRRFRITLAHETDVQPIVRLHLFHLLATVSWNSIDLDVGVPPRGLHGEAYRGHIFWDELFVFPTLNLRLPSLTRSLLEYRRRRLPAARHAAAEAGYAGAMFPWQSGTDGREESQRLHLNPRSGRWIPDVTYRQRHVGAAVAYNAWLYYQATGDRGFLLGAGSELILEVARFWGSAATYDRARDRYVITGVVGPDEFHTAYPESDEPGIANNAYTNIMAVWVLRRALETLELLPEWRRAEFVETLGLRREELERWDEITRKMFVPYHDDGIISQFEGYERLAELDWSRYRERYRDIHRLDRILEAEDDSVNRYRASKQADVLMLFYVFSADELRQLLEPLGYQLPPDAIPRNIDYYLARTSHGSTLSAVVHAWVLARLHRVEALEYFVQALRSDVADIQGGTTAEGIHLGAMVASVDLLQRCFAGLETRGDVLWINPYWPPELGTLEFAVLYREHLVTLRITEGTAHVSTGRGVQPSIRIGYRGTIVEVEPGSTVSFAV